MRAEVLAEAEEVEELVVLLLVGVDVESGAAEVAPVRQLVLELGHVAVAELFEGGDVESVERLHRQRDVDDGLRGEAGNRRGPDVLDHTQLAAERRADLLGLLLVEQRPEVGVRNDLDPVHSGVT